MSASPQIPPLTRNGYSRTAEVEADILSALTLDGRGLAKAFEQDLDDQPGHLATEALVFFIRREFARGDSRSAEALFGLLVRRCLKSFRSMIRGVDDDARDDIQADVLADMTRLILADDDKGDFLQCRFWLYLRRRIVTARTSLVRSRRSLLLSGDLAEAGLEAKSDADVLADDGLSPEAHAILADGLNRLPFDLRELVILRHYEGWRIGDEPPERRVASEPSLAERYGITARGVRKRLVRAEAMLKDGGAVYGG